MKIIAHITPNAKEASIEKLGENEYRIRVDAPPTGGKANKRLVQILAGYFNVAPSLITIEKGAGARIKRVTIASPR